MTRTVDVHFLPTTLESQSLSNRTAVVVDILRASTTMTCALANGAVAIIPCGTIDETKNVRTVKGASSVLRGGERGGVRIAGFELSNSPDDYASEVVSGKAIAFTTTNGTRAILRSAAAEQILIGAFVNLSAIVARLMEGDLPVTIVCAGTDGIVTGEDVLFAGAVVEGLTKSDWVRTDAASMALNNWRESQRTQNLPALLRNTQGGRNLIKLGFHKDIETAAAIDQLTTVGRFDPETSMIQSL